VQAFAEGQETLLRKVSLLGAGLGLGTTVHLVPFQDSMSVVATGKPKFPTAVQALAETQEMPSRMAIGLLGLGTIDHVVPFQDSMRAALC
jgi:hypothetical protein